MSPERHQSASFLNIYDYKLTSSGRLKDTQDGRCYNVLPELVCNVWNYIFNFWCLATSRLVLRILQRSGTHCSSHVACYISHVQSYFRPLDADPFARPVGDSILVGFCSSPHFLPLQQRNISTQFMKMLQRLGQPHLISGGRASSCTFASTAILYVQWRPDVTRSLSLLLTDRD
jgi:hypothetical protein